jgi:hypothetical protein
MAAAQVGWGPRRVRMQRRVTRACHTQAAPFVLALPASFFLSLLEHLPLAPPPARFLSSSLFPPGTPPPDCYARYFLIVAFFSFFSAFFSFFYFAAQALVATASVLGLPSVGASQPATPRGPSPLPLALDGSRFYAGGEARC